MPDTNALEVALFPIPNVVAFPGTVLPLHVFEPRYRQLVHDCVKNERMVGVSHVRRTIRESRTNQTLEEALSSNQATYQPREVFSAGRCEIIDTTSDGRIIARVLMSERLVMVDEVQSLPYRIVSCAPLDDDAPRASPTRSRELQRLIHDKLIALVAAQNPEMSRELEGPAWASLEPGDYSFRIFQVLRFDAEVMQTILETRDVFDRLETIWDVLRRQ